MADISLQTSEMGALDKKDLRPARLMVTGLAAKLGEMDAVLFWLSATSLRDLKARKVVVRENFDLNKNAAGNRYIDRPHVERIRRGVISEVKRMLVGVAILAADPDYVSLRTHTPINSSPPQTLVEAKLLDGGALDILDFQHRNEGVQGAHKELEDRAAQGDADATWRLGLFQQSSIPVLLVLEKDPKHVVEMFVRMATTKPIASSLIVAMDRGQQSNDLAVSIAEKIEMLKGKDGKPAGAMEYLKSTARGNDKLYPAAPFRSACAIMLAGFRDRTPQQRENSVVKALEAYATRKEAEDELVGVWDYAYRTMPGWREVRAGTLERSDFRSTYVLGSSGGMYAFAGVVGAALGTGVDPKLAIDEMAKLEWRKDAVKSPPRSPDEKPEHPVFDDTLVRYRPEVNPSTNAIERWTLATGGGTRTAYERATREVLELISGSNPALTKLGTTDALKHLGLA